MTTSTTTTTTSETWRWLTPAGRLAHMHELVAAHGWRFVGDEAHGLYNPRKLVWAGDDGLRVTWLEYHEHGVRGISVTANDEATRDAVAISLDDVFPLWSDDALRRDAHCADLIARLTAVRTWTIISVFEPDQAEGRLEAIAALARDEDPLARVVGFDLAYLLVRSDPQAIEALARERIEQDAELAESWQRLLDALAAQA